MSDTISGVTTLNGTPAQARVSVINVESNDVVGTALSDAGTGAFSIAGLPAGVYELLTVFDGYKPRVDGPWMLDGPGGDPYWANVSSLLHFDGDLTDETGKAWTAVGDAAPSNVQAAFGGALYVGTNSYIQGAASADFNLPYNADWTIEGWVYLPTGSSARTLFAVGSSYIRLAGTSSLQVTASGYTYMSSTIPAVSVGAWHHFALVSTADSRKDFYIDGVEVATSFGVAQRFGSSADAPQIGARDTAAKDAFYLDDIRVSKGVARYTEDFTPPDAPFQGGGA